ncbi:disulfide oxidoreductase [Aureibacillus halotolerans]|uniref:Probable disulfide formation protein n=1 Tax=Aureibacillus halotolerans TaxID=1508390 RepID=A0A4V3D4H2_9BACI|nr:disulfide oxidoreductase [Aureibacillus halotolerans]TDQ36217.1 disulfide bond formation protein DsbB [Aureibacillus halotolerans]
MNKAKKSSFIQTYALYAAWIVSVVATLGSLYFSEIKSFVPCELCWLQRIFMYPLAIILGIAAFYNEVLLKKYVLPLSVVGGLIAFYHYLVQKVPGFAEIKPCVQGVPCSAQYINWFGFVTIPFLAFIAFTLITMCMVLLHLHSRK